MGTPRKILAIQFKYLGDTAILVPALRALREAGPKDQLHLLLPEENAPVVRHLPWIDRLWPMPRRRGQARLKASWPLIRALRLERFDRSVDFGGNDRGAILSLLCGARERLGPVHDGGFIGRRWCYTHRAPAPALDRPEAQRLVDLLSIWGVEPPSSLRLEIHTDPNLEKKAAEVLPVRALLGHLSAGQPKKEWPASHWASLARRLQANGRRIVFSVGVGARERELADALKRELPDAAFLPAVPDLDLFLAVLQRAELFISGDTGPLHLAAGLGVPTLALFGATLPERWAPFGADHQFLRGTPCRCDPRGSICQNTAHCLAAITPDDVFARI